MEIEYLEIFNKVKGNLPFDFSKFEEFYKKKLLKDNLIEKYSFAVPTEEAIKEIIKYSPLIELGSGTGYWAFLINKLGGDIIAIDNNERNKEYQEFIKKDFYSHYWFDVKVGNQKQLKNYPERTLFLCWIERSSEMGLKCLKLYKGKYFIHIGEGKGGACATDSFFKYLNKRFKLIKEISIPQWRGVHDYLEIYKRN